MANECPKCRTDNPENSKFCKECTSPLTGINGISISQTRTLQTPSERLTRGARFADRYEIIEKLGEGGMGAVYRVDDTKVHEEVALKIINPYVAADKQIIERFRNELKFARKIRHKHVCQMFDLGEDEGTLFITMEYVAGEDLKSFLRRSGKLTIEMAVRVAKQACEGLAEAHRLGIVHRDLKPSNIMIDKEGTARIMDFGIARSMKAKGITGAGLVIGTPEYMSPEHAEGKEADSRSDIYSLGVILFEMLTGQRPFEGDSALGIAMKHKGEMPKNPKEINPQIPDDLSSVILKCLEKEKENRYQSANKVWSELDRMEKGLSTTERIEAKIKPLTSKEITVSFKKRWAFVAVPLVIILAATLSFFLFNKGKDATPSENKSLVVLPFEFLGPQEDEYFAAGITDEVTNRLSFLHGLDVISLNSAIEYEKTSKTIKDIGKELKVDYVVTGKVSWDKSAGEKGSVRVIPRLIRASDDTRLWSDRYEREIESIFDVQSEIAEEVIKQLDLTLLEPERRALMARPTDNLKAYDFYLRGIDHWKKGRLRIDPQELNRAGEMFEKAVELDPSFVHAYTQLSNLHSLIFFQGFDKTEERLSRAKKAVDKALELQPDSPEAKRALGIYYYQGFRDYDRALELFESVKKARPNSSPAPIGWIQRRQGKYEESLETVKKAIKLDPRSPELAKGLANTYSWLRRYEEADREYDRTLSLSPDDFRTKIWKMINSSHKTGNTQEARALLQTFPPLPITDLAWITVEMIDRNYEEVLEKLASLLFEELELQDSYYNKDLMYATVYNAQNKPSLMEPHANSARTALEKRTSEHPEDPRYHVALSLAYALLGQKDEAIREGNQAVKLVPISIDAFAGPKYVLNLAKVLSFVGEYDAAIDKLEYLMSIPAGQDISFFSLQIDPEYDSLRDNPRFQALMRSRDSLSKK